MKKTIFTILSAIFLGTFVNADDKPLIVPTPKYMSAGKWDFEVSSAQKPLGQIVIEKSSPILKAAATEINKYIKKNGGKALPVTNKESKTSVNIIT